MKRNKAGFTILELLLTITIVSLLFSVAGGVISMAVRTNDVSSKEFDFQSDMRLVSETLNQKIKFSQAVFTLKKETFERPKKSGWRYLGIEEEKDAAGQLTGKKQIVEYVPIIEKKEIVDGEEQITYKTSDPTHNRIVIMTEQDDSDLNLYFTKDKKAENGKLLEFVVEGSNGNTLQKKMTIKTQLQALNALVVEHEGNPAVAIAYREDNPGKRIKGEEEVYSVITLTLDRSGSMEAKMGKSTRIKVLNERTAKLVADLKNLDKEGKMIYINIIPYHSRVDGTSDPLPNFQNIQSIDFKPLKTQGGTNTGEALVKAYHMMVEKPGVTIPAGAKVNYYNILLTDGTPLNHTYYEFDAGPPYPQDPPNMIEKTNMANGKIRYKCYRVNWEPKKTYKSTNAHGLSRGMAYVKLVAKDYISASPLNIKSYIIGFGSGNDTLSKEIASYAVGHNTMTGNPLNKDGKKAYYSATSSEELDIVYSAITETIKGDMWHVTGPY